MPHRSAAILAVSCAAFVSSGAPAAEMVADSISMTVNSWGNPIATWHLEADGRGEYDVPDDPASPGSPSPLVKHRISVGAAGYDHLLALLHPAEAYAGKDLPCDTQMTDQPYGEVVWRHDGKERRFRYNAGCMGVIANPVIDALRSAWDQVKAWGCQRRHGAGLTASMIVSRSPVLPSPTPDMVTRIVVPGCS